MFVLNLLCFNSFSLTPLDTFKDKQGALNRNSDDTVENQQQDASKKNLLNVSFKFTKKLKTQQINHRRNRKA